MNKRKVRIVDGIYGTDTCIILVTDAPQETITAWIEEYSRRPEDDNRLFGEFIDGSESIDGSAALYECFYVTGDVGKVIGFDESYDLYTGRLLDSIDDQVRKLLDTITYAMFTNGMGVASQEDGSIIVKNMDGEGPDFLITVALDGEVPMAYKHLCEPEEE